jgi:ankyrin repeat protein
MIEKNELNELKSNLDKRLVLIRNNEGKSPLHLAIEKSHLEMALYLVDNFPILARLNDCVSDCFFFVFQKRAKFCQ